MDLKRFLKILCSLELTVVCLAFAIILVFVGTLAQVEIGLYAAQARYFRSFVVLWNPPGTSFQIPVLPGGYLIGGVLLANLIAAHIKRFGFTRKKAGILMVHAGLILLLAGQLATDILQVESAMRLTEGQAKSYSESQRYNELAVLDTTNPEYNDVVAVPEHVLETQKAIHQPNLPFTIQVRNYYPNSDPQSRRSSAAQGTQGVGQRLEFVQSPRTTRMDARDVPAAELEIFDSKAASLGTWWVSPWLCDEELFPLVLDRADPATRAALLQTQSFKIDSKTYELSLRPRRIYLPFFLRLLKFSHDRYMGTDIPKNFASRVQLVRPATQEDREVLIYMNNPLRYGGQTFYQASFDKRDPRVTILQVVRNPGWLTPYLACCLVGAGLLYQFLTHLIGFVKRRTA